MALRLEPTPGKAVAVLRGKITVAAVWHGRDVLRPYVYPFLGPGGAELTRLGHPLDPVSHSHHRSIWMGHHDVSGVNFWEESPQAGRIEAERVTAGSGEESQVALTLECAWRDPSGKPLLLERRIMTFSDLQGEELAIEIETELRPASPEAKVVLGDTPFGLLGIRVARSMRVAEGLGGQVINSQEGENEAGCHWQHARWCDYSGPVPAAAAAGGKGAERKGEEVLLRARIAGLACFSHPSSNAGDTLWHVRDDGWMGPCISKGEPRTITAAAPLRARYRIEAHAGTCAEAQIAARYEAWLKG